MQQILKMSCTILLGALCLGAGSAQVPAQSQKPPSKQEQADDVVRVKTELVQTDVTVIDKRGRVVAGLKPEQFELRVDSKPPDSRFFRTGVYGKRGRREAANCGRQPGRHCSGKAGERRR